MSRRNLLGVPVVFIPLLVGLLFMVAGVPGTEPVPSAAHYRVRTWQIVPSLADPDPNGYIYADSNEPDGAVFDWLDVTDGTALNLIDNAAFDITLPFVFTFYDTSSTNVAVYSRGALFVLMAPQDLPADNEPLSTASVDNIIAPFWDCLAGGDGTVYYKTIGEPPDRRFVVAWHDFPHWDGDPTQGTVAFEVILYEGTNNVKFQYLDTEFGDNSWDYGASATAGIRQDDTKYLQYSYDQAVLYPEMAICFQYPGSPPCDPFLPPQIGMSPTHISASQLAGEVTSHTLTISNSGGDDLTFSLEEVPPTVQGTAGQSVPAGVFPLSWIRWAAGADEEVSGRRVVFAAFVADGRQHWQAHLGTSSSMDSDVPWLAKVPETGTIAGGASLPVTIVFTAPEEVHDTYTATLRISSNDPLTPQVDVPLTMTVVLSPRLSIAKYPSAERVETGSLLTYTLVVSNAGGPVSGVSVSDTLPPEMPLAWIGGGGTHTGNDVLWRELYLPQNARQALSYALTVTCVPSGTEIANRDYQVEAPGWPPPVQGQPVTVTAIVEAVAAQFDTPVPILCQEPVAFINLSQNATAFLWSFGDGFSSSLDSPVHSYTDRGTYTAVLTASSLCWVDTCSRSLSVEDMALAMSPALVTGLASPGQTAIYTLSLTNTGTLSDSFVLTLTGHRWHTALSTETIGPLAVGSQDTFQVLVTVPPDAVPGEFDQVTVQAVSSGDPRQPPASAATALTTRAQPYKLYLPLVFRQTCSTI
jgi:uncharacterized repeat protein (TIGR01451 family)